MDELKQMREARGWSQQKLADESGVNKATINQIERGRRSPNVETLARLADALNVELGDFFPKAQSPLPLLSPSGEGQRAAWQAYGGDEGHSLVEGPVEYISAPLSDELRAIVMESRDAAEARDKLFRGADTLEARQQALASFVLAVATLINDGRLLGERAADRLEVASKLQAEMA
jgi:transcriptional regulator with XRE-family HTH domain